MAYVTQCVLVPFSVCAHARVSRVRVFNQGPTGARRFSGSFSNPQDSLHTACEEKLNNVCGYI